MELFFEGQIKGAFTGWKGDAIFELTNGTIWKQAKYKYQYKYMYRPAVKIWHDGSNYLMEVEGMDDMVEIRRHYKEESD